MHFVLLSLALSFEFFYLFISLFRSLIDTHYGNCFFGKLSRKENMAARGRKKDHVAALFIYLF